MPSFDDDTIEEWRAKRVLEKWDPAPFTSDVLLPAALVRMVEMHRRRLSGDMAEELRRLAEAQAQVVASERAIAALDDHRKAFEAWAKLPGPTPCPRCAGTGELDAVGGLDFDVLTAVPCGSCAGTGRKGGRRRP